MRHNPWFLPLALAAALVLPPVTVPALTGDFNGDGEVRFDDFIAFARRFGTRAGDAAYDARYDLDASGEVGFPDFLAFAAAYAAQPEDLREDPEYLDGQIKHIADADLFAAVDLDRAGLEAVKAAVDVKDYAAAYRAWGDYWAARPGFAYVNAGTPFCTVAEARDAFRGSGSYTAAADRVAAHNIRGWGDVTIQHGPVVDFNADYGDSGKYGFHYWGWSRPLLWACLATGRSDYLDAFDELFNQWYEQRDQVEGAFSHLDPVWYELGLGSARNRIFLDFYRLNRERTSVRTHERLLKNFLGSARWLHELQRQGYRSGNWQVMGSYALAELGLNFPEFRESARWVGLGTHRMEEHLARDFFPDGCHSERCPSSYSTIVYRDPRNLADLLTRFGGHEAEAARLRPPLERTLNHWMHLLSPLGTQPAVNDGGRGRFDASIFVEGGRAFGRPDLLWVARNLLGADIPETGERPAATSVDFRPSGFAVMRADWTRESPCMVINYGPYGGGHSHADVLSFELFAHGRALAVDAGIGVSYDDPLHRPWYVTSPAHNMLVVDGRDLDRVNAVGENVVWSSQDRMDYFAAEHRGYYPVGVGHRRHFVFVRPDAALDHVPPYFLVYDTFTSVSYGRTASAMVHTPVPVERREASAASTESPGLLAVTEPGVTLRQGRGMANLGGVSSPARREIDWIAFDRMASGGNRTDDLPVVLYPFNSQSPPDVALARQPGGVPGESLHLTVAHTGVVDHIVITEGRLHRFGDGELVTDARCALVRTRTDGVPLSFAAAAATHLVYRGQELVASSRAVDANGRLGD